MLEKISEKTLIITGIEKTDGFLVTDFKAVSQGIGKNTAYSFQAYAKVYFPGTTSYFDKTGFPSAVIQQVASLPERKAYELTVEKGWKPGMLSSIFRKESPGKNSTWSDTRNTGKAKTPGF